MERKEPDRKWAPRERGGSVEYGWGPQQSSQSHQTSPVKQVAQIPARLEIGAHVHPDRVREIESAAKINNEREGKLSVTQSNAPSELRSSSLEGVESSGAIALDSTSNWTTPAITSPKATITTPQAPSRAGSSSGQSFRGALNPPSASGLANPVATTHVPVAPAATSGSPTKVQPPTAPRALQSPRGPFWNRRSGFRAGGFGVPVKREVGDDSYRSSGRGNSNLVGAGMGTGAAVGRGSIDRGRRESKSGLETDKQAAKEGLGEVEMVDPKPIEEKKEEALPIDTPPEPQDTTEHTQSSEKLVSPPASAPTALPPPPVVKIEDEDDEDVLLTQADVISKMADIDLDIQTLEAKLESVLELKKRHLEEVERLQMERELEDRVPVPPPEDPVEAEKEPEPDMMDIDVLEEINEETQIQNQVRQEHQEQQERQERAEHVVQSPELLDLGSKEVGEELQDLPDRPRTPSISPSPSTSGSRTPSDAGSIETESDESIRHLLIPTHPDLPFYRAGSPMKPSDYDFFHANIRQHEGIREIVVAQICAQKQATLEKEVDLKRKFREFYEPWHERCLELEKESNRRKKGTSEPADVNGTSPAVTASTTSEAAPVVGRRTARAGGDVVRSEAELEQVIKNLTEQDERGAESGSRPLGLKEAIVPAMILDPSDRLIFEDTNRLLLTDDEIKNEFLYDIPEDDWTEAEQKQFCDRYMQYPKQWGRIAQGIHGRDFKACILHYYMTKKAQGYKELQKGGGKRGRGKRRKAASTQKPRQSSALIADLGRRGGEDEDADSEDVMPAAMTESGRPKRAAAPVFGVEASSTSNNSHSETPGVSGKRGSKDVDEDDRAGGSTKRTRGGNNTGRDKGQKRVKTPAAVSTQSPLPLSLPALQPQLAPVPEKVEKEREERKEDLRERESDAASVLTGLSANETLQAIPPPMPPPQTMPPSSVTPVLAPMVVIGDEKPVIAAAPSVQPPPPSSLPVTSTAIPTQVALQPLTPSPDPFSGLQPLVKRDKAERAGEKPIAQTSSYWSVPEQTDFPHLLASFGTNWAAIAGRLASKTTVMVLFLDSFPTTDIR